MNENNITKQETMERKERKEQLINEYEAALNLAININERVHQYAAKRLDLTFDECVECLWEAVARRVQSDKEKKMTQLTKDFKTMLKYGIRLSSGVELAKAGEMWGLSYDEVLECWQKAIA